MTTKQSNKKAPSTVAGALPAAMALADLNKAIDAVNKLAASVQSKYQEVGVQALMHLAKHGDVGPVNRLFLGMPKGVRKTAMGSWMLAHGSLQVNTQADTKKTSPLSFDKKKKTDPEAAMADPWFEHLPEKDISDIFDLQRAIHMILQKAKGKTIKLHGQTISADDATDRLKAMAALVGEDYKPDAIVTTSEAAASDAQSAQQKPLRATASAE